MTYKDERNQELATQVPDYRKETPGNSAHLGKGEGSAVTDHHSFFMRPIGKM